MANSEEQRSVSAEVPPSFYGGVLPQIPPPPKKENKEINGQTVNVFNPGMYVCMYE
jgi:hypothetical protein